MLILNRDGQLDSEPQNLASTKRAAEQCSIQFSAQPLDAPGGWIERLIRIALDRLGAALLDIRDLPDQPEHRYSAGQHDRSRMGPATEGDSPQVSDR